MTPDLSITLSSQEITAIRLHKHLARTLVALEKGWLALKTLLGLFFVQSKTNHLIKTGEIFEVQGEPALAVEYYEKALARAPRRVMLHLSLGRCQLKLVNLLDCRKHLAKFLLKRPDDPEGNLYNGMVLYYMGEADKALPFLVKAEESMPDRHQKSAAALEYLGECHRKLGNTGEAIHFLEEALKMNPYEQNPHVHLSLGEAYYALGNRETALSSFQKALRINPGMADVWNDIGVILYENLQLEKAGDCFRQAVALKPGYPEGEAHLRMVEEELRRSKPRGH